MSTPFPQRKRGRGPQKRGQAQGADLQGGDEGLNRQAKTLSQPDTTADAAAGYHEGERDDHLTSMLRKAVPDATPEEIEHVVSDFHKREAKGEFRVSASAYLRGVIQRGDAQGLIDKARRKITSDKRRASRPARCRVCHQLLDPAVVGNGVHPTCEPDDAPNPLARRQVPSRRPARRGPGTRSARREGIVTVLGKVLAVHRATSDQSCRRCQEPIRLGQRAVLLAGVGAVHLRCVLVRQEGVLPVPTSPRASRPSLDRPRRPRSTTTTRTLDPSTGGNGDRRRGTA